MVSRYRKGASITCKKEVRGEFWSFTIKNPLCPGVGQAPTFMKGLLASSSTSCLLLFDWATLEEIKPKTYRSRLLRQHDSVLAFHFLNGRIKVERYHNVLSLRTLPFYRFHGPLRLQE